MPRPLGFIWAAPMAKVREAGGFDEGFMPGYWFDDDDFFYRLWNTGADFIFDDSVRGVHQHHERAELTQDGIARNQAYMLAKHGELRPLTTVAKKVWGRPGRTVWQHPRSDTNVR